jgi:hypothetical protein
MEKEFKLGQMDRLIKGHGLTTKHVAEESSHLPMAMFTKVNLPMIWQAEEEYSSQDKESSRGLGGMIYSTETVHNNGLEEANTKGTTIKEGKVAMEGMFGPTKVSILVTGITTPSLGSVGSSGLMVECMMESGKIISNMGKGSTPGQMVAAMRVGTEMIKGRAMGNLLFLTVLFTRVNGKIIYVMAKEWKSTQIILQDKEYGNKENSRNG